MRQSEKGWYNKEVTISLRVIYNSMELSFRDWLEVVQTHYDWPGEAPQPSGRKDNPGFPILAKPGFRKADMQQIERETPNVERWLDKATGKFGVNWLCLYIAPEENTQTIDDPETAAQAVSVAAAKRLGAPGWNQYKQYSGDKARNKLNDYLQQFGGRTSLNNTIVYIKPTSRVHTLKGWQLCHNIGHAVWDYAKKEDGGRLIAEFNKKIRQIIAELQQKAYTTGGESMPNAREIIIMLGRVLGVGASFRRIFGAKEGDFDKPAFRVNTAMNSYSEAMYDMLAIYLNSGGKIPINTQGPIAGTAVADRGSEIEPNAEINRKYNPRDFVWKKLAADQETWQNAVNELEPIIGAAFEACTWGKQGGPVYSTTGYVTTSA